MSSPERHSTPSTSPSQSEGERSVLLPSRSEGRVGGVRDLEASFNLRRSELRPAVRSYVDNLIAQVRQELKKHGVKTFDDLEFKLRYAIAKRQMSRDDAITVIQPVKDLMVRLKDVIKTGEIPEQREIRERLKKVAADLQDKLNSRLKHFHKGFFSKPEQVAISAPDLPPDLTQEHLDVINELYPGVFAERVLPTLAELNNMDDAYVDAMYPKKQDGEDKKRGLASVRRDGWNTKAIYLNAPTPRNEPSVLDYFVQSMRSEFKDGGGSYMLIEQTLPCQGNQSTGEAWYGSLNGASAARDPFASEIMATFGRFDRPTDRSIGRSYLMWQQVHHDLLPIIRKRIVEAFEDRELQIPDLTVSLVPALAANLEMTFYHPEWTHVSNGEYSSTLLTTDAKGPRDQCLITGSSDIDQTGAAGISSRNLTDSSFSIGFRFAIIFKKAA